MKYLFLVFLLHLGFHNYAQSILSLQGGCTISKIRTIYDSGTKKGTAFGNFSELSSLYTPFLGIEYKYNYRKLWLFTGISFTAFGSGTTPLFGSIPWPTFYWIVPLLIGYEMELNKNFSLIIEGGVDIGFQQGESGIFHEGTKWGNINAVLGVELAYKRFRLGVRGHWGLTDFRYFPPITYKHTAVTTYLSYDIWDHAKCKARRLKKQQEKQLEY